MFTQLTFLKFNFVKSATNWRLTNRDFRLFLALTSARKRQEWVSVNLSEVSLPPLHLCSVILLLCFSASLLWPLLETCFAILAAMLESVRGQATPPQPLTWLQSKREQKHNNNRLSHCPWQLSPCPLFFAWFNPSCVFLELVAVKPFVPSVLSVIFLPKIEHSQNPGGAAKNENHKEISLITLQAFIFGYLTHTGPYWCEGFFI